MVIIFKNIFFLWVLFFLLMFVLGKQSTSWPRAGANKLPSRLSPARAIKASDVLDKIDHRYGSLIIDLRGNGGGGYGREVFMRFNKEQGPSASVERNLPGISLLIGRNFIRI